MELSSFHPQSNKTLEGNPLNRYASCRNSTIPAFSHPTSSCFPLPSAMEIFVHKNDQQHGPYDEEQLLTMLNEGQVGRRDLIFYEGMAAWQPLEEIFDVEERLLHYMDEGQEPDVVAEVYQNVSHIIASGEKIFYLAHQKKRMMKSRPDVVVVTNERLIIIRQGLGGSRTEDYLWKNVVSVQMKEGIMGNTFSILDVNDHIVQVDDLPKTQLEKLCQFAQEMRAKESA